MADNPFAEFAKPAATAKDDPFAAFQKPARTLGGDLKQTASAALGQIGSNLIPSMDGLKSAARHPLDTLTAGMAQNRAKVSGDLQAGHYPEALAHGLGGYIPVLGPMAAAGMDAIDAGDPQQAGVALGNIASIRAIPAAALGIGSLAKAAAVPAMEGALRIRGVDRAFGKSPGLTALRETTGVRPGTIARQASEKIGKLTGEFEGLAKNSVNPVDLTPARGVVDSAIARAGSQNAAGTVKQLEGLQGHLNTPIAGFQGAQTPTGQIAPLQDAMNAVKLKRGLGHEFVSNWNPETMRDVKSTAVGAYGKLDKAIDAAVPEGASLNQRISSLIPIANRAESAAGNAGIIQRTMGRFGAHTGALAGAFAGAHFGGIPGAIAGAVGPELLASPTVGAIGARTLFNGGRFLQSPAAKAAGQASLIGKRGQPSE